MGGARDLAALMRAVPAKGEGGAGYTAPASGNHPPARQPGTYVRSNGDVVPIAEMNPHHRASAAAKARAAGDHALADELSVEGI